MVFRGWVATSKKYLQTDMGDVPLLFKRKAEAMRGGFKALPATLIISGEVKPWKGNKSKG
jgi:hypothetical protein